MVAAVVVSIVELVEPPPGGPKILDRSPMPGREIPGLCDSVQLCAQNASEMVATHRPSTTGIAQCQQRFDNVDEGSNRDASDSH